MSVHEVNKVMSYLINRHQPEAKTYVTLELDGQPVYRQQVFIRDVSYERRWEWDLISNIRFEGETMGPPEFPEPKKKEPSQFTKRAKQNWLTQLV